MRRALVGLAAAGAAVAWLRRRRAAASERVELYFEDGSMVLLGSGSGEAERLGELARAVLAASRP